MKFSTVKNPNNLIQIDIKHQEKRQLSKLAKLKSLYVQFNKHKKTKKKHKMEDNVL